MQDLEKTHFDVKQYYSQDLTATSDLKTSACSIKSSKMRPFQSILNEIPCEIQNKFYGCGVPIPMGINGLTILDLGCGTGRDCYLLSKLVGPEGKVIGVDMLDSQLDIAKRHIDDYTKKLKFDTSNMSFYKGYIEDLSSIEEITPESIDIVISNCVINLSPRKDLVLKEVFRVLKKGGEIYFSDMYSDRRVKQEAKENKILIGEGLGGALYINDFISLCKKIGFYDPRELERREIEIYSDNEEMKKLIKPLGETKYFSITYRLFKLDNLESNCEDYGQYAVYKGTIVEMESSYLLDDHHKFEMHKPKLICGNTAAMLRDTWLHKHFQIIGEENNHYGIFPCGEKVIFENKNEKAKEKSCC